MYLLLGTNWDFIYQKTPFFMVTAVGTSNLTGFCSSFGILNNYKHNCVRFEVFTAVNMKNGDFGDVMPRGSCKNRCFGGT
jgi:hypothetical protein